MAQGPAIDSLLGPPAATTAAPPIDSVLGASTPATPVAARPATPDANTFKKAFGDTPLGETFAELGRERNQLSSELKADVTPDKGADTDPLHNLIYGPAGALRAVAEGTAAFVAGKATYLGAEGLKAVGAKVDPDKAEQSVEDYLYYKPKTVLGQEMSKIAAFPLTGLQQFGNIISEEVYEANPDKPALAAIASVLPDVLGFATPFQDVGKSIALKTTERAGPLVKTSIDGMNAENARAVPELKKLPAPKGDIDEALAGEKVVERRSNTVKRTKIDELLAQGKHAEVKEMLYRNDMTGLPNGLAFKDDYISAPAPYIAFMDTDSLKFRNDTYGEAAGDEMIRRVGKTLKAQGLDAYRLNNTGDEFLIKGQTPAEINANLHKVADALELQKFPDGTAPRITWGISETGAGNTYTVAEANMRAQKVIREANGQRAARGATPPDFKGTDFQDLQDQQDLAVTDVKDPEALIPPQGLPKVVNIGPGAIFTKPIGQTGNVLYRETSPDNIRDLHDQDKGAPYSVFVTDDRDLAIGQGANKGIHVEYDASLVSGREHQKPGTGIIGGREYQTDYFGKGSVRRIYIPKQKKPIKLPSFVVAWLKNNFDKVTDGLGGSIYTKREIDQPVAGQVYRGPEATSTELQRKRITKQDEDIGTRAAAGAPPPEEPPEGGGTPEDWQARAKQVAEGRKKANSFKAKVAEAQKFIHHYFPDKTGIGEEASYTLAQVVVRHAQMRAAFMHASELRRAIIARLSDADQLKFIHEMQTGVKGGMLPEVKKAIREITEDLFRRETSVMVDVKHRADYFPQYFLHPEQVSAWWESQRAERLKTGKASFQFERHWNDIAEAIDEGGAVPISNNAEDLLRMRYMASNRLVARAEMLAAVKDHGLIRPGDEALPGEKVVEGPDGVKYVGDESVMQMIENGFFSNSLWNEKTVSGVAFRTAMGAKMIVMPLELGLSAFHPIHLLLGVKPMHALAEGYHLFRDQPVTPESLNALAKVFAKSIMNVGDMRFHPIKATLNMLQGVEQNYASRPYKIIRDAWLGKIDPKDVPPEVARDIQHMLAGGFRPVPTAEYIGAAKEKAMDAWSDKNLGQLAKHIIPYVLRQLMTPVMDWYVPYLKTQAFIDGKNRLIDAHPELESPGLPQTLAFSRLRRNIDLRFSELPYDIQFWNKSATGTMQAGFLSFTWLYGYVDQFPMALTDVPRLVAKGMSKEKGKTYISSRMSYALLYSAYTFMLGGLITYALTGNRPKQVKDFLYPVRHVDPDGTEHRISLPFFDRYPYDAYALYQAQGAAGLARMGAYRLDPVISMLSEQVTNKNFYDQELSDPTAPWLDRMGQRAKGQFISMTPISVAGLVTHADTLAQESKGQQAVAAGLAFLGGNPAPSYISKTTLENKLAYLYNHYHQDTTAYGKLPEIEAHRNLRALYKAGKMDEFQAGLEDAAQKFQWSKQSLEDFVRSLVQPAGVFEFEGLPPAVQVDLLENEMTPAEAAEYLPFASVKAKLAYTAAPNQ